MTWKSMVMQLLWLWWQLTHCDQNTLSAHLRDIIFNLIFIKEFLQTAENLVRYTSKDLIKQKSKLVSVLAEWPKGNKPLPIMTKLSETMISCLTWSHELTHLPQNKMAAFSQTIFSDTFLWMKSYVLWLKFHWNLFLRVQLTTTQHWSR